MLLSYYGVLIYEGLLSFKSVSDASEQMQRHEHNAKMNGNNDRL